MRKTKEKEGTIRKKNGCQLATTRRAWSDAEERPLRAQLLLRWTGTFQVGVLVGICGQRIFGNIQHLGMYASLFMVSYL